MCEIREEQVSEEPWSLWALMEKRCKNSCKMSNEGCKMTTKWHKMTATWQQSSAKQPEGDRKAALNYQKTTELRILISTCTMFASDTFSCPLSSAELIISSPFPIMHVKGGGRSRPLSSLMFTPVPALEDGAHCDTKLSKYWPSEGLSIGGRRDVVQPCSRLSWPPHPTTTDLFTNPGAANRRLCPEVPVWRRRKCIHRRTLEGGEHKERLSLNHQARLLWFYITSCVLTSFQPAHNRFRFLKAELHKGWQQQ